MKKVLLLAISVICFYSCTNSDASMPSVKLIPKTKSIYSPRIEPYIHHFIEVLNDNTIDYDWYDGCRCNVGLLAQIVTKESYIELKDRKNKDYSDFWKFARSKDEMSRDPFSGSWQRLISYYCSPDSKTMKGVVGELIDSGFTKEDLAHLEFLSDKQILSRMDKQKLNYGDKNDVISYLETWEKMIN